MEKLQKFRDINQIAVSVMLISLGIGVFSLLFQALLSWQHIEIKLFFHIATMFICVSVLALFVHYVQFKNINILKDNLRNLGVDLDDQRYE